MAASFAGFPPEALRFFRQLERNNRREWFEPRKHIFLEMVRAPMEEFVAAIDAALALFAPEAVTLPERAIYRIYRDTRFSADKSPYKTHIAASFFRSDLGRHVAGGYYVEISHRAVGIAGGVYMPTPENLRLIRVHIMENHERFDSLAREKKLLAAMGPLNGDRLARPPKGFPANHPAVEWLKFKHWYFWKELPAELATTRRLVPEVVSRFRLMKPVIDFLNEPLLAMRKKRLPLGASPA
ncbi:MAG: TIGR02453 family protein [Bryobacteraceae bacterium]|nr:MAG: TIGR02453 family protein [Bryobacteraceae bacterium]